MIIIFCAIIILFLTASSIRPAADWKDGYISVEQSSSIKGLFVLLIFIGHAVKYMDPSGILDDSYLAVRRHLDQAVVVMFLFYSGFGMMESLKKKKADYIRRIPARRILPLVINFEAALVLFLIADFFLKRTPSLKTILAAMTGWEDIGNFSWFFFIIVCLYILFCISFLAALKIKDERKALLTGAVIFTILSAVLMILLHTPGHRARWYYDTLMLFPAGTWYSLLRNKIEKFLDSRGRYIGACALVAALYAVTAVFRGRSFIVFEIWIIMFTAAFILLSVKIRVKSMVFEFFNGLAFQMIILQGLPFLIFDCIGVSDNRYVFVLLSFAITLMLSLAFKAATDVLTGKKKGGNSAGSPA